MEVYTLREIRCRVIADDATMEIYNFSKMFTHDTFVKEMPKSPNQFNNSKKSL